MEDSDDENSEETESDRFSDSFQIRMLKAPDEDTGATQPQEPHTKPSSEVGTNEELVQVPPASSGEDLDRLAALTYGLTPEQVEEMNQEIILMPKTADMDVHLGWDLEQVAQVFQEALSSGNTGPTLPEVNFEQEDLTIQKIHQLKQALQSLERNDDTLGVALLKGTNLAERVTLTILKERPDLSIHEVYNNAIQVTTILRTQSQREIEQAYREIYYRDRLAVQPTVETVVGGTEEVRVPPDQ